MPSINKSQVVPYTSKQMYDLVNDVGAYPEFVPFCVASHVHVNAEDELQATLEFARGGFRKSFSTLNRLRPDKMVEIRLIDGPFKHLEGFWCFEPVGEGCRISLDLEFEFSTRLLATLFGPMFHQLALMLVDAFCKRAEMVYGDTTQQHLS